MIIRNEDRAPLREITPSTQVGRLSGSHSDIGFHLFYSQGEKGEGTERWQSPWKSIVEQVFHKMLK